MPHLSTTVLEAMRGAVLSLNLDELPRFVRSAAIRQEAAAGQPAQSGAAPQSGPVAVIPVYGVIEHRSDFWMEFFGEGCSVETLRETLRSKLTDPAVQAVVLDIDSPGGSVAGITELAAEIRASRGTTKPIVAVANTLAASAAYWLATQCDELVVTPSGSVGSIGVYAVHQDVSRMLDEMGVTMTLVSAGEHKTEGNEYEPLSDEARADIQGRVDATYRQFLADVAAGRRVSADDVEANFGGGRVFAAKKALAAGMVDRVETLGQTKKRLSGTAGRRRAMAAEDFGPDLEGETDTDDKPGQPTFTERVVTFAAEAAQIVHIAEHRARSRAADHRPFFSTTTETALRASRDAIDALLSGGPREAAASPGEPALVTPPVAAPTPARFKSRADWLRHLEASSHT